MLSIKKIVPELITPYNLKAMIDFDALSDLIEFYIAAGAKGFFVNTFTSEMYSISEIERLEIAKKAVQAVNNRVPVYATGSFGLTIADKAEFSKKIFDTGIDAVLLVSSHYANVDQSNEELIKNFHVMSRLTGNIPFGLYEGPIPYKRIISPTVLRSLLSSGRIVNIIDGTNDTAAIKEKLDITSATGNVEVFESFTPNALSSLKAGAAGLTEDAALFFPEVLAWLCENVGNCEKTEDVMWLQQELMAVYPRLNMAFPLNAKYFLRKRGILINSISRAHSYELTPQQKRSIDALYSTFLSWCHRLKIEPVNFEELKIPRYPLDPAV